MSTLYSVNIASSLSANVYSDAESLELKANSPRDGDAKSWAYSVRPPDCRSDTGFDYVRSLEHLVEYANEASNQTNSACETVRRFAQLAQPT